MIYLFHGENQVASRKALVDLKGKYDPSAVKTLSEFSFSELVEACEARALFSPQSLVVLETSDVRRLVKDRPVLDYLQATPKATGVAFWVGETVKGSHLLLKLVRAVGEVHYFGAPEEKPFSFLDALGERNSKKAYVELRKLFSQGESEIGLLQLIAWEVKNLIEAKTCVENPGMNSYVFRKAGKQSGNFSEEKLVGLFGKILEADVAMKTGSDPRLTLDRLVYEIAGSCG